MEQRLHAPPIGIDLGNAYTRIAVYDGSQWRMIPDHDYTGMPSYVAFTNSGVLVGEAARNQAQENPTNTIFDIIRLIGRRYSDPSIRNDMRLWPFQVSASPDDRLLVDVSWKSKLWHFTPVEICSLILIQLKRNAETNLRSTIVDAVITVPVHYNYEQRQAIRKAGMIAGLNFMQIISVPAASALFFGMKRQLSESSRTFGDCVHSLIISEYNMIIFHVGPGTLDVSLVTIKENMCKVRATAGNVHLSGSDFGNTTVDYFVKILTDMCLKDAKMGANMVHEVIIAGGSTRIPLLRFYVQQYFKGKKLNLNEQLDTARAYGAALQAFFCCVKDNKRVHCLSLLDVTPFTLGIKSSWGMMAICVPKNTTIPTKMETIISHSQSNNTKFLSEVYEGERRLSTENNLLGKFELCGIPISCDINVSFEIHKNGTLTVTAGEISSGMRKGIKITDNNIEDSRNRVWEAFTKKVKRILTRNFP